MAKTVFLAILAALHSLALTGAVAAQSIRAAESALSDGNFAQAVELAKAVGTSGGYAFAAGSLALYGAYIAPDDRKGAVFRRAADLAEEAIRLDPANPEAHLQSAHAMGRYTRTISLPEVIRQGLAERVRDAIGKALELDPDLASAHLSMGTWHSEICGRGGILARTAFGASPQKAVAHYRKALQLEPDEKIVYLEYASGLLLIDSTKYRENARSLLRRGIGIAPKDALDRIIHEQLIRQLASLDA